MKKLIVVFGVVALLAAAATWFLLSRSVPVDEVADLLEDEGERILRDPMRPVRGRTRVLVFALDGVGEDEFMNAVRGGSAPRIAAFMGPEVGAGEFAHAWAASGTLSILPSTTMAAWASLFTGEPPARTGVPGNEFFVREERRFYAPAPVTVADVTDLVRAYTDGLVGDVLRVPTVYEQADVRAYVALSHIHRGADLLAVPEIDDLAEIALSAVAGVVDGDPVDREPYAELDTEAAEMSIEAMQNHGVPDLQVIYFPGVDLFTHIANDPTRSQREFVSTVIDAAVGAVLDAYRAAGVLDQTYVLFVSDHGHTPVLHDDRHALGAESKEELPSLLERAGFRMRPLSIDLADDEEDFQAVLAYQGAFSYIYLADRSGCVDDGATCDWSRAPRLDADVLPVVRALHEASTVGAHVPALRGAIDMIFAREPRPPGEDALPFQVWDGRSLVDVDTYLAAHPRPDLVQLAERLHGLGAGPYGHRAGDVLLLTRSGAARPIEDRFYFSGPYRSWHGSPDEQDSRIPLVVAHSASTGTVLRSLVTDAVGENPSQLDITPLILTLLADSTR